MEDLRKLGYMYYPGALCGEYEESQSLKNRGVDIRNSSTAVTALLIHTNYVRTVDGARVGMTLGEVKGIYGDRLRLEDKIAPIDGSFPPPSCKAAPTNWCSSTRDQSGRTTTAGSRTPNVVDWIKARPISATFNYDGADRIVPRAAQLPGPSGPGSGAPVRPLREEQLPALVRIKARRRVASVGRLRDA